MKPKIRLDVTHGSGYIEPTGFQSLSAAIRRLLRRWATALKTLKHVLLQSTVNTHSYKRGMMQNATPRFPRGLYPHCFLLALIFLALPAIVPQAEPIRPEDFDSDRISLSGDGWTARKHLVHDNNGGERCYVELSVEGTVLHDLPASPSMDWPLEEQNWTRFHLFETPTGTPDVLAIVWFAGGAHGPLHLYLVGLGGEYPLLFTSSDATFGYLDDLDGDGMPEAVLYASAFEYFYRSAVTFNHAESPFPLLVAAYDPSQNRYTWSNERFPGVLVQKEAATEKRFRTRWPGEEKIPVSVAVDQHSNSARAYRVLMSWAVDACYRAGPQAGEAIIDVHTDPALAVFSKHALTETLRRDTLYSSIDFNPVSN